MVLNISGINKLTGHHFHNRTIEKVTTEKGRIVSANAYVFHFPAIPYTTKKPNSYKQWEDEFEVYLYRNPNGWGKYELFWMGLHGVTVEHLDLNDIKKFGHFAAYMGEVVRKGKKYWYEN
jgi:hypothetical protein